ncbi:MAG: dual specificity protein phosphatase family protein [Phycisphaerae bacterium]|nr:dual specificity protein phosphatase family protein [Phycisphaerae bacterium]
MHQIQKKHSIWIQCKLAILLVSLTITGCTDPIFFFNSGDLPFNFHELDAGKAYRSSQPTAEELKNVIDLLGIKTVINLRGPNPDEPWYNDELRVCREMDVTLVDHRMSAGSLPKPELLREITNTLQTADYPILIHCRGGSDRTGAISAIYRMLIAGEDKNTAMEQLSTRYFHFRMANPCMDYLAEIYEPTDEWLEFYTKNFDQLSN